VNRMIGRWGLVLMMVLLVLAACGTPATTGTTESAPTSAPGSGEAPTAVTDEGTTPTEAPTEIIEPTVEPTTATESATSASTSGGTPDAVTLQLKWVAQGQFAGYYAAQDQGYYEAENLDVTIRPGGPDIVPEQVVASGQAQIGLNWLPSLLANRDQGVPLVNIAQVFQYSGMRQISFKTENINSVADLKGKNVGVWVGGNEFELFATLAKNNINKDTDLTIVAQKFDMNAFLSGELDAASAMTYNEYYQVLAAGHTPDELNVIDFNKEGTAMLEDGLFTTEAFLQDEKNKDIAARFLRASFKGWEYCRDNVDACVQIVLKNDQSGVMTQEAQKWQVEEINKLIWPLPECAPSIGYMCPDQFKQTADIANQFGVISKPATDDAYTHEIWEMASGN
jgi:NitT/TauT family transport system substrate-binding protein